MALVADEVWERLDVSHWVVRGVEQAGSSRNLWLAEPGTGHEWLHKDTVIPGNGIEQGEDWAEVVSTQVSLLLGAPCATTRLCVRQDRRGSISRSVRPDGHSLNEGNVVLQRASAPGYFPHGEGDPAIDPSRPLVRRPGHSLANVRLALEGVVGPPGFRAPEPRIGFDAFAGYMILDALVANRDRHEQNWAVLTPQLISPPERLSPSYDHASSLGFNLTEPRREICLREPVRMRAWAEKGTAYRFEHIGTPPTLVQHAARAVGMCSRTGADWWCGQLMALELDSVLEPLRERAVPGMSDLAARFAHNLLTLNLGRLRDEIRQCA